MAALAAKVQERKEFLGKVVPFVQTLLRKRGKRRELRDRGHSTHDLWELKNFGGFSFEWQTGVYSMGNGGIVIVRACTGKALGRPLIHVSWNSTDFEIGACEVESLMCDSQWKTKLLELTTTWEQVAAAQDAAMSEVERRRLAEEDKKRQEAALREEAKRLGL